MLKPHVGPSMARVLGYVQNHPDCYKAVAAKVAVPNHPRAGYDAADRCIAAGLLVARRTVGHWSTLNRHSVRLNLTDAGRAWLDAHPAA